ncbi:hypothetical protein [Thiothrix fructosivorans]|uniref:Uncharacterized protein n=1 Tax=Thiothrix fructosivorans TaxID=111770 RepID=A0A8B0SH02_9GAMM|nr:hypothetical protein [Thiothrix fructosivorans]MBO0611704.1 hypothetical protein [Thiothrix fructosivorans]QTX10636.1 hypothetical protein J1836_019060 [Thiothrix fructosivorans]
MTDTRLQRIPPAMVDKAWAEGAMRLEDAMHRAASECTGSQLKLLLMRGEMILVQSGALWAAIHPIDHPNKRVLHVYAVAGSGINDDVVLELWQFAQAIGCTAITAAADDATGRLYQRMAFRPVYQMMEFTPINKEPMP